MSVIQLPMENKIELALVSFLWQFGGLIPADLLNANPAYFDNPAFFTPNPIRSPLSMPSWPANWNPFGPFGKFPAVTWYPGHASIDLKVLPRIIVTCAQAGGTGAYAGYDTLSVEILCMSKGTDALGMATRHKALRDILQESMLNDMQDALNKPAGNDTRAVQGFGLDGLEFVNKIEGRDTATNEHGARLNLTCTAHLEPS